MPRRGLNSGEILDAAAHLAEEKGYDNISLRELAARLAVQPASLYNHIRGIDEINAGLGLRAAEELNRALSDAIGRARSDDDAFLDAARAYRRYATENPERYKALMRMPASEDAGIRRAAFRCFLPMRDLILRYGADEIQTVHFIRSLRAVMHGYVSLAANGFMRRSDVSRDESYDIAMRSCLQILKKLSGEERHEEV